MVFSSFLKKFGVFFWLGVLFLGSCATPPQPPQQKTDQSPPTVSISSLSSSSSSCTVTVSYQDESGVKEVSLSILKPGFVTNITHTLSSTPLQGSESFTVLLPVGSYTLSASATDKGGNVGTTPTTNITITSPDTLPPLLEILSPTNGQTVGETVTLILSLSDNSLLDFFFYEKNGSSNSYTLSTPSTNLSLVLPLEEGTNRIYLCVYDKAGQKTNTLLFLISDRDTPEISILSPLSGTLTNSSALFITGTSFVSTGLITVVQLSLNGGAWLTASGTTNWSYSLGCSEGSNLIRARAISSTGKTNIAQISVTIDTIRPILTFTSPSSGITLSNTSVTITGTASDSGTGVVATYLKIDNGNFFPVGTTSFSYLVNTLSEGSHTVAAYAMDAAGNFSLTNTLNFTVVLVTNTNVFGYTEYTNPNYNGNGYDIILQGFHWSATNRNWWTTLATNAPSIASAGFTMVWFPPVSDSADNNGYLPRRWYTLASCYGNGSSLSNAVSSLRSLGIKVIADIVINHRVGTANWADFTDPAFPNNNAAVCSDDEWKNNGGNPTGALDTGAGYEAGRDLDHTNPDVRSSIIGWMRWLRRIGFDGWRYDYVKGYHSRYNSNYNEATKPYFSVGELWPDISGDYYASGSAINYHRQALMNWIDNSGGTSSVFDFTTKWQLMLAVERNEYWRLKDPEGKPIGAIGWWPAMSVTFVDNHDTGYSPGGGQHHWPFPQDKREIGYAYILTHPGIPCVYWYDYFESGNSLKNTITTLIAIRKSQGIRSTSPITILKAEATEYVALINSNTIVKLGPGMSFTTNWTLAAYGNNWAVWTN
ncbi:MAG: alpha-amylase family glycosyl hydrolase [Brevinematales bacterium]|nr:alpha-amylase family glycosyl hydrolase [Brevinematales bacterium]